MREIVCIESRQESGQGSKRARAIFHLENGNQSARNEWVKLMGYDADVTAAARFFHHKVPGRYSVDIQHPRTKCENVFVEKKTKNVKRTVVGTVVHVSCLTVLEKNGIASREEYWGIVSESPSKETYVWWKLWLSVMQLVRRNRITKLVTYIERLAFSARIATRRDCNMDLSWIYLCWLISARKAGKNKKKDEVFDLTIEHLCCRTFPRLC